MNKQINLLPGKADFLFLLGALLFFTGCKKDKIENTNPPVITGVTSLDDRVNVLPSADFDQWIIIKGSNLSTAYKIDFNGELASDSLFYANDTSVTVKIPKTLPDPVNNPITVTTQYGTVTYNFKILQPPPVITGFDPVAAGEGDLVTILGDFFNGVTSVRFNDTEATIVSNTRSEIKVNVPVGQTFGYVHVTTPVGTAVSEKVFGFQLLLYGEALASGFYNSSYSCSVDYVNTAIVKRGVYAAQATCTASWGAVRFSKNAPAVSLTGYTALKFSVYGGPDAGAGTTRKVKVTINGVSASGYTVTLTPGQWTDFQIPLSSLGNPATISSITFQEFSGIMQLFYLDDVGLI